MLVLAHAELHAQDYSFDWRHCANDGFPEPIAGLVLEPGSERSSSPVILDADRAVSDPLRVELEGDAILRRGDQRLAASSLEMDRKRNVVTAQQGLRFDQGPFTIFAERGRLEVDDDRADLGNAEFFLRDNHLRGTARELAVEGDGEAEMSTVSFTTCQVGNRLWAINAREMALHRDTGRGEAWHATLRVADVPVFYMPYMNFPIDDRRASGFLPPRVGYSDRHGFDLTVPYYWNIAPERDLTFLPRYMGKRGLMLGAQYRYLGRAYEGELNGTYLADDKVFGDNRYAFYFGHRQRPSLRSTFVVDYSQVSDDEYLNDFSDTVRRSSESFLNQTVSYLYSAGPWRARKRAQPKQTVDSDITPAQEPYKLLPELSIRGAWPRSAGLATFELDGELTNFDHDLRTDGVRLNVNPSMSLPLLRPWGFLTPKVGLSFTSYALTDNRRGSDHQRRAAPIVSIDSGLIFERPLDAGERRGTLTLEPRLFYLYVPFKDQSQLPNFDTANYSEDFYSLFRENRFTGPDRLGDANQITTALTSRWLVEGNEQARLSVGQIQYFEDRQVTLSGIPDTRPSSDLIAEAWVQAGRGWSGGVGINWNPEDRRTSRSRLDLRYNPEPGKVLDLSYRVTRDELEQVDAAIFWPLAPRWKGFARWYYSLDFDRTIEAISGLQFEDCCWAIRFAARHYRDAPEDIEADNAIYVELILKGLGGIGTAFEGLLSDAMPGFQDDLYR
jgi:LPS-assembly protein